MRMPIHWAASGGHTEIVDFLLNFHVPVDARDEVFDDITEFQIREGTEDNSKIIFLISQ